MTDIKIVHEVMEGWPQASLAEGKILVPTHCIYPSNGSVVVTVEGGIDSFVVHDNRGACEEVEASGVPFRAVGRMLNHIAQPQGLTVTKYGLIASRVVPRSDLLATIILTANASKEAAHDLLARFRPRPKRNFREELARLLEGKFASSVERDVAVLGASHKQHKFHLAVNLPRDRKLLVDGAVREATSINSVVVAHLDVRNLREPSYEQRIIYDDSEPWSGADLQLLSLGARTIPFSRATSALDRLAA